MVKIHKDVNVTLKFLDEDQRKVVSILVENNGELYQSKIVKGTKMSRVKVSRCLFQLEEKEVLSRNKDGMTNVVKLSKDLFDVFVSND